MKIKNLALFVLMNVPVGLWAAEDAPVHHVKPQMQTEERLVATPEMAQLLIELDPKAYGYRAKNRRMQVQLDAEPLLHGRFALGFQHKLNSFLTLDVPVMFESSSLALPLLQRVAQISHEWAAMGALGLKIRVSEWLVKSSFYIEPMLQMGYYVQTDKSNEDRSAFRIRPALYVGWERIYDTGFVVGTKVGVEQPFDIVMGKPLVVTTGLRVVPMVGVGYAF